MTTPTPPHRSKFLLEFFQFFADYESNITIANGDKIMLNYERFLPQIGAAETWWAVLFIVLGILVLLLLDWYGKNREKNEKIRATR